MIKNKLKILIIGVVFLTTMFFVFYKLDFNNTNQKVKDLTKLKIANTLSNMPSEESEKSEFKPSQRLKNASEQDDEDNATYVIGKYVINYQRYIIGSSTDSNVSMNQARFYVNENTENAVMGDTFMKTWGQTDPKTKYEEFENLENVQKIDFQGKQYYFFYFRMSGNNGNYKWILPMVLDKGNLVVGKYSGPYNMRDSYFVDKGNGLGLVVGRGVIFLK